MEIISISLFCFAIIFGILWLILYFPIKWLTPKKNVKKTTWIIPIVLGLIITYYLLFTSPAYNHEYASIVAKDDIFELTLTGERTYMAHDPVSAFRRETYTDTLTLKLPRNKGTIRGYEIIKEDGYPILGRIEINNGKLKVDLYYDNYDDHIKDPLSYNGEYKLK